MATNISIYSSTPRTVFRGIEDQGAVNIAMPVESTPIRFPLFMSFSPFGSYDEPLAVNGSSIALTHGGAVIDARSKFFNHQSLIARSHFSNGGSAIFLRLQADGAAMATARLGIDIVKDDLPIYERNDDGTYRRDSEGRLIDTGDTTEGHRAQWRVVAIPSDPLAVTDFGRGSASEGQMVSTKDAGNSTFYPIMDVLGRWEGESYNNIGFRIYAPSTLDREALDPSLVDRLGARPYRIQVVRRSNPGSSAQAIQTLQGEKHLDFTFIDAIDDQAGTREYNLSRTIFKAYESEDPENFSGYGPFSDIHIYNNHLEEVLKLLVEQEEDYTLEDIDDIHAFNFITGSDVDEIPYHTYKVEGPLDGGVLLTENSSHFLTGGDDGDVSSEALNQKWDEMLDNLQNTHIPFSDIARMPYDIVVDSGFPLDVKLKFVNFHNLRPDVYPHVCTQDVLRPLNTPSEDSSILLTLRSTFRSMIESPEFGTKATRFALFNCAGYFADDDYTGIVPFMEYIILKGAAYMGAASGKMDTRYSFGRGEKNIVTRYVRHNAGLKPLGARSSDWENGVNYPEFYDMKRLFYPGLQSIYADHTSPLHSYFNVQISCNQTRIGHMVWRELSGDDQLDDDVFLTEVQRRFQDKTHEVYDGRTVVTPRAYYTALDTALGTHWHLDAANQFKNIKTTQVLAIIAQRVRNEENQ